MSLGRDDIMHLSQLTLPGLCCPSTPSDGQGGEVAVSLCESFSFHRVLAQTIAGIDCMFLILGQGLRIDEAFCMFTGCLGHHLSAGRNALRCGAGDIVLGDFNNHTVCCSLGPAQDFKIPLAVLSHFQIVMKHMKQVTS